MSVDENEDLRPTGGMTRDRGLGMEILDRIGPSLVLGWLAIAIGLVLVLVGYWKVSGTSDVAEQLAYFASACVGGLFALGAGGVLILSHHYQETARTTSEMRRAFVHLIREAGLMSPGIEQERRNIDAASPSAPRGSRAGSQRLVIRVAGGPSFHAPNCIFVEHKEDITALSPGEALEMNLRPCQVCEPATGIGAGKKAVADGTTTRPLAKNSRMR